MSLGCSSIAIVGDGKNIHKIPQAARSPQVDPIIARDTSPANESRSAAEGA
jgi:hypothetical protein